MPSHNLSVSFKVEDTAIPLSDEMQRDLIALIQCSNEVLANLEDSDVSEETEQRLLQAVARVEHSEEQETKIVPAFNKSQTTL